MDILLAGAGVACLIAAVGGVAIKAMNVEIGKIVSFRRQVLLGFLGIAFLGAGLLVREGGATSDESDVTAEDDQQAQVTSLPESERLIRPISASATSTLQPQGGSTYAVGNLLDNDQTTAWCEGASANGINESVTFSFARSTILRRIDVINGYNKDDRYDLNSRAQNVEVASTEARRLATLRDTSGVQHLPVPDAATNFVKLTIKSAYTGTQFTDLCLTDIQFIGVRTR